MGVLVPTLVRLRIAQTEVGADVDDRAALVDPRWGLLRGFARRERGEDDLGVTDVVPDPQRVGRTMKVRLYIAQRLALMRARDRSDEAHLGMAQQDARELSPRVPGDPDDRDPDGHRTIMRSAAYLCKHASASHLHDEQTHHVSIRV